MSRKSRHGRRQPQMPRNQRQDASTRRLVALPTAPGVVRLADGTSGRIVHQSTGESTSNALANQSQRSTGDLWSQPTGRPYPPMERISPDKPLLKSLGATGTAIFSGIITSEEYNSDFYWKDAIQIYEQMIRNDAQIFAMTQLLELPIRRATWSIEPASDDPRDKEIASFVESCLFHDMRYTTSEGRSLTQKWDDILRHILMMLRYGFMAFEKVYRIEDGWVKWARWTPLLPRTIWRWWVGEDNELVGVQQWTFKDYTYQFVDIPADKLLLFVHRQEGNNYEGVSVLRSAYKHWYYKDNFYKIQSIDIERNGVSMPVTHLPENFTQEDINNAQSMMANIRANEQMGITLPPGWQLDFGNTHGSSRGGPGTQIDSAITHHDMMIARNILGQFLNLGSNETGSYALAQEQTATFLAALQAECEYVEDVINDDAIPELVNYNYEGVATYPRLKASKVLAQDFDAIADALNKLTNSPNGPLIHYDPELEDFLRNELGLPKAPKSAVEATNPTAPSTPERPETDAAQAAAGNDHADAQSQTAQPSAQQEATSQAIANGAPNANTQSGQVQESGTAASDALTTEVRLLREALDAVGSVAL